MYTKRETEEILKQIRAENEAVVKEVYLSLREEFILWMAKNFNTTDDLGRDLYQESFLSFIENVNSEKLISLTSTIKTYLFSIGKNKYFEYVRKQERERVGVPNLDSMTVEPIETNSSNDVDALKEGLRALGDPCAKLLFLFYFKKKSLKEIATELGYKNVQTAKNQKYKCILRLREIMKKGNKHD